MPIKYKENLESYREELRNDEYIQYRELKLSAAD